MQPSETGGPGDPGSDVIMPRDICEWAAPEAVNSWVHEELKAMSGLEPQGTPNSSVMADPMLAVLAFAYARGVFDSEEIGPLCHLDPHFLALSNGGRVLPSELRSFRHKDRGLLVKLLALLFVRATRQKFNLTGPVLPPKLRRRVQETAVDRLDSARHIDRGEDV